MFRALWLFRHAPLIWHSQTAAVSALVLSAVPHDAVDTRFGSEYGDQLLDDHDLAGLRWREHDELLQPDGGTLRAEFLGRRGRVSRGRCLHPRSCPATLRHAGNFWVDLTRALLWILLPGALIGALLLVSQGVPMNFHHYAVVTTVEGTQQVIPQGPVAALEIIKNLGTNGGGFFNANGAHPYENPTPLTNFLEMLAIVLLPAAFTNTFGRSRLRCRVVGPRPRP